MLRDVMEGNAAHIEPPAVFALHARRQLGRHLESVQEGCLALASALCAGLMIGPQRVKVLGAVPEAATRPGRTVRRQLHA